MGRFPRVRILFLRSSKFNDCFFKFLLLEIIFPSLEMFVSLLLSCLAAGQQKCAKTQQQHAPRRPLTSAKTHLQLAFHKREATAYEQARSLHHWHHRPEGSTSEPPVIGPFPVRFGQTPAGP